MQSLLQLLIFFLISEDYRIYKIMKNEPMTNPLAQRNEDSIPLSPLIGKVIQYHKKNQEKEIKAQDANSKIMKDYQERRKIFEIKTKNKSQQLMKRLIMQRKKKVSEMKKKSEHVQKVMEKFIKIDEKKYKEKVQRINKRNLSLHSASQQKKSDSPAYKKSHHLIQSKYLTNSLDLKSFYEKNYERVLEMSKQIMNKSLEKQKKVDENRKILGQNSRIKELNKTKYVKILRAAQYIENKQNFIMRKSIKRLQQLQRQQQEQFSSQRKKSLEKKQAQAKNIQKIKKKRHALQVDLQQKYVKLERIMREKNEKVENKKEIMKQSLILNKKRKRLKQQQENQLKHSESLHVYTQKMSEMYKKDREQWGFLTSAAHFKQDLITKNIYQNNQLTLMK